MINISFLNNLNPIVLALLSTLFTFLITTLGSSFVFFFKDIKKLVMDICLSLSAGIMLSASYFSLLNPSIELSNKLNISLIFTFLGFILGGLLILVGGMLQRGISLEHVNTVFFLNESESFAKYLQSTYRCLTEEKDNSNNPFKDLLEEMDKEW